MSKTRSGEVLNDAAAKNLPLLQAEIASVLCCCKETIQNYTRQGMPCLYRGAVQGGKGSRPVYRYLDCIAWLESRQ